MHEQILQIANQGIITAAVLLAKLANETAAMAFD